MEQPTNYNDAEVAHAIGGLSEGDLLRLRKAASAHMRTMTHLSLGRTQDDLLKEAVTRTLSGERAWRKGIDLLFHLNETMRSICSSWRKSLVRAARAGAAELPAAARPLGENGEDSVLEQARSQEADLERQLIAKDEVERITNQFASDRVAAEVIAGWKMGLEGPEICQLSDISEKEFRAAVRRIRRSVTQ